MAIMKNEVRNWSDEQTSNPESRDSVQSGQLVWLFGKQARLAPAKFRRRLMRGLINESMQSLAQHRWLGFFAFRIRKIRWLGLITAALQIELNESLHG